MQKYSGYFIIAAFLIVLAFLFYLTDEVYLERTMVQEVEFRIEKGESLNSVISRLEKEELVRNKLIVRLYLYFSELNNSIKPGLYDIGPKYSVRGVFEKFNKGTDIQVKIFEGWTSKEIALALEESGVIKESEEFLRLAKGFDNSDFDYEFLPRSMRVDLEGYLFPDTYKFERGSAQAAIEKILANFKKKVFEVYSADYQESLRNIIIMASMLEREVRTSQDMQLVSGVLWKRFESGLPLQVDATLVYLKCVLMTDADFEDESCRLISSKDKELDSLYNTYLHKGLPPGPISNPGLKAIEAAAKPVESRYWYYLSARDDGRTIFSESLDEHNLNRVLYR